MQKTRPRPHRSAHQYPRALDDSNSACNSRAEHLGGDMWKSCYRCCFCYTADEPTVCEGRDGYGGLGGWPPLGIGEVCTVMSR